MDRRRAPRSSRCVLAVQLWFAYDRAMAGVNVASQFQFVEHYPWIPSINMEYFLGVDGISMPLMLLTALLSFLAVIGSFGIDEARSRGTWPSSCCSKPGMMGVFLALDFFLFYVFWEVMLLPMYFLIGIWGGPRREYAAIKFFLYTLVGSVLMLIVHAGALLQHDESRDGRPHLQPDPLHGAGDPQRLAEGVRRPDPPVPRACSSASRSRCPLFPFHTWLPDAHVEAPDARSP